MFVYQFEIVFYNQKEAFSLDWQEENDFNDALKSKKRNLNTVAPAGGRGECPLPKLKKIAVEDGVIIQSCIKLQMSGKMGEKIDKTPIFHWDFYM